MCTTDGDRITLHQTKFTFNLNASTSKAEITAIIDYLDEKCALDFFDYFYPTISDSGAYVTVHKVGGEFHYERANHGWSSDWKTIERNALIFYIYKNRNHNDGNIVLSSRFVKSVEVREGNKIVSTPQYYSLAYKKIDGAKVSSE